MPKHGRTKLVPQSMELPEEQSLEVTEESRFLEQRELDNEIECPRCNGIMELNSSFDALMYSCENCSFLLSLALYHNRMERNLLTYSYGED